MLLASINFEYIFWLLIFLFIEANGWLLLFRKQLSKGEKLDVNFLFGLIKVSRSKGK